MRISTKETAPSTIELVEILKQEFSDQYSYEFFGLGQEKSIIVQKSTFVGVQISRYENEFILERAVASPIGFSFAFLDLLVSQGDILKLISHSPMKKFEKEVATFLTRKFS